MGNIDVSPHDIRTYAATTAGIAGELTGAAGIDLAANMAAMTPVFGLVGAGFLAAFDLAQANYAKSFTDLAAHFAATAQRANEVAAAYERTDQETSTAMNTIGNRLEA